MSHWGSVGSLIESHRAKRSHPDRSNFIPKPRRPVCCPPFSRRRLRLQSPVPLARCTFRFARPIFPNFWTAFPLARPVFPFARRASPLPEGSPLCATPFPLCAMDFPPCSDDFPFTRPVLPLARWVFPNFPVIFPNVSAPVPIYNALFPSHLCAIAAKRRKNHEKSGGGGARDSMRDAFPQSSPGAQGTDAPCLPAAFQFSTPD